MHCRCDLKIGAKGPGLIELSTFVILSVLCVLLFCVKGISGTTMHRNLKYGTNDKDEVLYCGK